MSRTAARQMATIPCASCEKLNRVDLGRLEAGPKCGQCGRPLELDRPIHVSDGNMERVVGDAAVPVLVDFYADWCAPCRMMSPALEALAHDRPGRLLVAKLDTDRSPTMAVRFAIRGIPTLIVFVDGREAGRQTGAIPAARLEPWLDATIARASG